MAKKIYVGGLPYETTENELRDLFAKAGTVTSASIITDKMSGRSRGFGFIEMSSDEEADAAIEKFNGTEFSGRSLVVNEARPLGERRPGDGNRDRGDHGGFSRDRRRF